MGKHILSVQVETQDNEGKPVREVEEEVQAEWVALTFQKEIRKKSC